MYSYNVQPIARELSFYAMFWRWICVCLVTCGVLLDRGRRTCTQHRR